MTIHEHCDSCVKKNCVVKPDEKTSCQMVYCSTGCGFHFHMCKLDEHRLICSKEKVPCINKANGCPLEMARERISHHLLECPVSLICTREWNRWPMHSQDKGWKAPMPFKNPHVKCGQFDVAFALRDQKILMESFKTPKKTRRALRNPFTQCYPAVPIQSHSSVLDSPTSETSQLSDDESGTPWDLQQSPPGLQQTILNQLSPTPAQGRNLYSASREATESLSKALDYVTGKQGLKRLSEITKARQAKTDQLSELQEKGNVSDQVNDGLKSPGANQTQNSCNAASESYPLSSSVDNTVSTDDDMIDIYCTEKKLFEVLGLDLAMHFICSYQAKPLKMFTFLCGREFRRDEYQWHVKNFHLDIQCNLNCWFEQRCPLAYLGCTFAFQRLKPKYPNCALTHSSILNSFGVTDKEEFEEDLEHVDGRLTDDEDINTVMGRKRLREATPEIHTSFKCDAPIKVVPRYKSVSRETSPDKCFGSFDEHQHSLTNLPFEVLQKIARNLDGFSLQHLSMTCKLLQNVCCSLLDEKGIVSLIWEKNSDPQAKPVWNVAYKKWQFSVGFSPVLDWEYADNNAAIFEHLKRCPFNQAQDKNIKSEPFCQIETPCLNLTPRYGTADGSRWGFSIGFQPVKHWTFQEDSHKSVAEHLSTCKFNEKAPLDSHLSKCKHVINVQESEGISIKEVLRKKRLSRRNKYLI